MSPAVPGSSFRSLLLLLLSCVAAACITGCGMGTAAAPNPVQLTVNGRVHGGQQPVVGAQIQLYVAGNTGNGSAASPLLNKTVTSGQDGSFSITGDYSCPSSTSQVYLVATQGNPGLGASGNNPALAMMAALGNCGNLTPTQFIWINEVTTVAAAWVLAPFSADIAHIGSSATNYDGTGSTQSGLANAFLNAQLIADTSTGNVATLSNNLTTEPGKIYALADAVAACVNSDGSSTSPCNSLFTAATPSGGTSPANTWDAVMDIVKNPGNNVAGVYGAIGSTPPFATSLAAAPSDWTLSLTVTGGGVSSPESVAVDGQGNVWVADFNGAVSAFSPQGAALSGSPFGNTSILGEDFGLAVDPSDNVWVTVQEIPGHGSSRGSVVRLLGVSSGGSVGTATVFSDTSINFPYVVAADSNGNIFIANNTVVVGSGGSNAVVLNPATSTFTQLPGNGNDVEGATALVPDASHGVWITSGTDYSVTHINSDGSEAALVDCCGPASAVALDNSGKVWMANSIDTSDNPDEDTDTGSVALLGADGSIIHDFITGGGITNPSGLVLDAARNVWITNLHDAGANHETISELSGTTSSAPGTPLSPSTGYGLDTKLLKPYGLAIDPSGNIWVSSTGGNDLVMFFGMAAPTKTPMPVTPAAP